MTNTVLPWSELSSANREGLVAVIELQGNIIISCVAKQQAHDYFRAAMCRTQQTCGLRGLLMPKSLCINGTGNLYWSKSSELIIALSAACLQLNVLFVTFQSPKQLNVQQVGKATS